LVILLNINLRNTVVFVSPSLSERADKKMTCPLNALPFNAPPALVTLFFAKEFPVADTVVNEPLFRLATAWMLKAWIVGAQKTVLASGVLLLSRKNLERID